MYKLLNWGFLQNGDFFPLNNDILDDSSDLFYPMARMFMPPIQMSSFVKMLTCSDEVQPSTASFVASQQLQMEANIHPTELPLHSTLVFPPSKILILFHKTQEQFPLVSNEEISEINSSKTAASKNIAPATKTWVAVWVEWCKANYKFFLSFKTWLFFFSRKL